jgi:hypothetical protein
VVDLIATQWSVPPSISGHNNYFLWPPRRDDGHVIVRLGDCREDLGLGRGAGYDKRSMGASVENERVGRSGFAPAGTEGLDAD